MNRTEKEAAVADLHERFKGATVALVAHAQGLSVSRMQELRRALRAVDGEYKVSKNTLIRRALKDTAYERLQELLQGPTGLVFGYADPVSVAKVLIRFAEENDNLQIQVGVLEDRLLQPAEVTELAKLPGREQLLGMLLGLLQAPAAQLLRTMQEPGARVARLLEQLRAGAEDK